MVIFNSDESIQAQKDKW